MVTELPFSWLRDNGTSFLTEFKDILSTTVNRVEPEGAIRELPGNKTDRNTRSYKEIWDMRLAKSDKVLR